MSKQHKLFGEAKHRGGRIRHHHHHSEDRQRPPDSAVYPLMAHHVYHSDSYEGLVDSQPVSSGLHTSETPNIIGRGAGVVETVGIQKTHHKRNGKQKHHKFFSESKGSGDTDSAEFLLNKTDEPPTRKYREKHPNIGYSASQSRPRNSKPSARKESTFNDGQVVTIADEKPWGHRKHSSRSTRSQATHQHKEGKPEREHWNIQAMPMGELKSLCKIRDSSELVNQLFDKLKSFQRTLQLSNKLDDTGVMDGIIYVLMKVSQCLKMRGIYSEQNECKSRAIQILGEVVSTRCTPFQFRLTIYVKRDLVDTPIFESQRKHPPMIPHAYCSSDAKTTSICMFFRSLLEAIPESSWGVLPVTELVSFIRNSPDHYDLLGEANSILALWEDIREQSQTVPKKKWQQIEADWDNSEYREEQILPEWEEVCLPDPPHRLRPNITKGSYTDWMHYYDVQFRLLREDFVAPLRKGICEYIQGTRGRKLQNVKVYKNVAICEPLFTKDGVCYEVQFDVSRLTRCRWEHSKRLLFGSLLCLSPDEFKTTIFFATVANREPEELKKGKLQIRFEGETTKTSMLTFCGRSTLFIMVESMAYFEANRHILHSLQTAEVATMPFTRYLVHNQCEQVSVPKYLDTEAEIEYNLTCLKSQPAVDNLSVYSNFLESFKFQKKLKFDVRSNHLWPSADEVELDESQLKAIRMALTQEIAVIQGPPGTGKTYVGLKIVEALLKNRSVWDPKKESPILVMCFTNHALDQFLEGIVKNSVETKIVRIGGRCQNDHIQQFSIDKIRRRVHLPSEVFTNMTESKDAVSLASDNLVHFHLKNYFFSKKIYIRLETLTDTDHHGSIVNLTHHYQLLENTESPEERQFAMEIWLGMFTIHEVQYTSDGSKLNVLDTQMHESTAEAPNQILEKATPVEGNSLAEQEESTEVCVDINSSIQGDSDVESEDEELIDIQGEANIEQETRVSADNYFKAKRLEHSQLEDNQFSYELVPNPDILSEPIAISNALKERPSHRERDYTTNISSNEHITAYDYETDDDEEPHTAPQYVKIRHVVKKFDIDDIVIRGRQYLPMTAEEASSIANIHYLSHVDRWRLYNFWVSLYTQQQAEIVEEKLKEYDELCKKSLQARREADRFALETAEVIAMTTTGAAKYQHILHLVKPKIVIVEEAAEVLESHIVSALNAGTQHLILIGDHKQLRPKPNDYQLAKKYELDISLFERLVQNNFPHATLEIQHRMRPEIAQLVKPHIYKTLINHHSVEQYDCVKGVERNLFFIQHENPETEDENLMSHSNQYEAQYLTSLCKYLLQQGYKPSQITILVTYAGQLLKMRAHMPKKIFEGVRVCTVDNFQGEENDIILLSLVRSNEADNIGFLKEENRVCVSLSRAKMGFYCIGNIKMLRNSTKTMIWECIMSDMEAKGYLGDKLPLGCANHPQNKFSAKLPEDFSRNAPDGGCLQECIFRLPCGHVCALKCHIFDPQHEKYECKKPCTKSCPEGHPCPLKCHEGCKPCQTSLRKEIPSCGHMQRMKCHEDPRYVSCISDCEKTCDNGHPCPKRCSERCGVCEKQVVKTINECGHQVTLPCYRPPLHKECNKPCEKLLSCGHPCKQLCREYCSPSSCQFQVERYLECGHKIKILCKESNNKFTCDRQCEKKLEPCGHPCKEKCSQPCTSKCMIQVNKTWPCGHKLKRKCYQTLNPLDYPCRKKCDKMLSCGHPCPGKCGDNCTEFTCTTLVDKHLQCGHVQQAPCSSTEDPGCKMRCSYTLTCGHRCEGECSKCTSSRVHTPCKYGVGLKRFCGHKITAPCLDLNDSHPGKQKRCIAYCPHKKCSDSHDCSTPCEPCTEPCAWNCPHYQCNKLCHEVCERPQCNKRCENLLKCGHQCYGLCGEPCLTVCPDCKRKDFNKCFKEEQTNFDPTNLYMQLDCKHIFTVHFIDQIAKQNDAKTVCDVTPLQCPACEYPLCSSYRYGNVVKQSYQDVNTVRDKIRIIKEVESHELLDELRNISVRLEIVLDDDMQEVVTSSFDQKRYQLLQKQGWYTFKTKRQFSIDGIFYRYKPLPEITEDLVKLKKLLENPRNISSQELYVIHFLVSTLELISISVAEDLKSISLADILCSEDIIKQLSIFVHTLLTLKKRFNSRLSVQIVNDLKSKFYYLSLMVQYCFAKKVEGLTISASLHSESDEFLRSCTQNPLLQVNAADYAIHSSSLSKWYIRMNEREFPSCFLQFERYYRNPPVLKGTWCKCPKGHYFCTPPMITVANDPPCPECTQRASKGAVGVKYF